MSASHYLIKPLLNSFEYTGKANRTEFFVFYASSMVGSVLSMIPAVMYAFYLFILASKTQSVDAASISICTALMIVSVAVSCWYSMANIALCTKRLRDADFSPWLTLLNFVPIVSLLVIVLCAFKTNPFKHIQAE
jgi:uncharacterized membrane protein YhaH (DUF805 family)